jgi:hypothetical protein
MVDQSPGGDAEMTKSVLPTRSLVADSKTMRRAECKEHLLIALSITSYVARLVEVKNWYFEVFRVAEIEMEGRASLAD